MTIRTNGEITYHAQYHLSNDTVYWASDSYDQSFQFEITKECLDFVDSQDERLQLKFFQLLEILGEIKVVHSNFIKKLKNSAFYELRIKAGNEYRIVIFAIDHLNFSECKRAVCLNGFMKKSNKDYIKALKVAEKLLEEYLKSRES